MLELHNGCLDVNKILSSWYDEFRNQNYGAMIHFVGIVRDENEIDGLSFDIYEPLLQIWFKNWQEKASNLNAKILMAHSIGDVLNHTSSYIACVLSPKRKTALKLINDFVEDFKANAPIWKYDLKNGKRIWAKDRSKALFGAGILA
nr:molybdenum cofactor biosynthesis protein MoaE [Campylobacter sp.]